MRLKPKVAYFLAFSAIFAGLAMFIFWGTWSTRVSPIMPDAPIVYSSQYFERVVHGFLQGGRFIPGDLTLYIGSPYFWQELKFVIALYLAALGMVYFCRGLKLSRLASYGAGLLLAFSGYWCTLYSAGHYGWFQWMSYGVFAFGLIDRALTKDKLRHWLMLGAVVAWGSFNQQDLWLLFTLFTAIYFLYRMFALKVFPWRGILIALIVFLVIELPNFRTVFYGGVIEGRKDQIASSQIDQWEFVTNWSLPPDETLEAVVPRLNGDTSCPMVLALNKKNGIRPYTGALGRPMNAKSGNYRQHSLYMGVITVILAIVGVVGAFFPKAGHKGERIFFLIMALIFLAFSYGRYLECVYRLIFALPAGDIIRCPVKWYHLVEFSIVVLAALGVESIFKLTSGCSTAKWMIAVLLIAGAFDLARIDKLYCAPIKTSTARRYFDPYPPPVQGDAPIWPFFVLGIPSILMTLGVVGYAIKRA